MPQDETANNYLSGKCEMRGNTYSFRTTLLHIGNGRSPDQMQTQFGTILKEWRQVRRMSQLDLGLEADVSSRHISFLESGRAKPSRSMVLQLAETLDVPRSARNALLNSAGYRALYGQRDLDEEDMSYVREAINRMIAAHDPYPAFALDRHWKIVLTNRAGGMVMASLGVGEGDSMIEALLYNPATRDMIENWGEVAAYTLSRLRTESAHLGGDPVLEDLIAGVTDDPELQRQDSIGEDLPAVVSARYSLGGQTFSVFSTIAQFGSAEDIALADLRIELLFPSDEPTKQAFQMLGN